jgi:hypothetical protein
MPISTVKLTLPEPKVLKIIAKEARRNRTNSLSSRKIDDILKAARAAQKQR